MTKIHVDNKAVTEHELAEAKMLSNATHFSVFDCARPELGSQPLEDLSEAKRIALGKVKGDRRLVYGFHFKPGIEICFQQVLLTPRTLRIFEEIHATVE
jgi:hypothetical protein